MAVSLKEGLTDCDVREGWQVRHGGDHDVYKHPARPGRIILPRHRMLSPGVARVIAKQAGWFD